MILQVFVVFFYAMKDNIEERHTILGCVNIEGLHFYTFKYNYQSNMMLSHDPLHSPNSDVSSNIKYFHRMCVAKSFGLIRQLHSNKGVNIYCGGKDMYKSSYLEANETDPSSSSYHYHSTDDNLPGQPASFNCGVFSMFYIACKVFDLDISYKASFDPKDFGRQLFFYIFGLKYYGEYVQSSAFQDTFHYKDLPQYTALSQLQHFLVYTLKGRTKVKKKVSKCFQVINKELQDISHEKSTSTQSSVVSKLISQKVRRLT